MRIARRHLDLARARDTEGPEVPDIGQAGSRQILAERQSENEITVEPKLQVEAG